MGCNVTVERSWSVHSGNALSDRRQDMITSSRLGARSLDASESSMRLRKMLVLDVLF